MTRILILSMYRFMYIIKTYHTGLILVFIFNLSEVQNPYHMKDFDMYC